MHRPSNPSWSGCRLLCKLGPLVSAPVSFTSHFLRSVPRCYAGTSAASPPRRYTLRLVQPTIALAKKLITDIIAESQVLSPNQCSPSRSFCLLVSPLRLTEADRETGRQYIEELWEKASVVALPSRFGLWGVFSLGMIIPASPSGTFSPETPLPPLTSIPSA